MSDKAGVRAGNVCFKLDDGELLTLTAADLAGAYDLLWELAPKPGALTLAATIRASMHSVVGAPIDLDSKQSAVMREAVALLRA